MVSGLNPLALWPSLLAVDMLIFAVPGAIIVAFLSWSSPEAFSLQQLPLTASFMALFGLASISQVRSPLWSPASAAPLLRLRPSCAFARSRLSPPFPREGILRRRVSV